MFIQKGESPPHSFPCWRDHELKGRNSCYIYYRERKLTFLKLSSLPGKIPPLSPNVNSFHSHNTQLSPCPISSVANLMHLSKHACLYDCQWVFSVPMSQANIRQRELDIKVVLLVTRFPTWLVSLAHVQQETIPFSSLFQENIIWTHKAGRGKRSSGEREKPKQETHFFLAWGMEMMKLWFCFGFWD